MGVLSTFYFMFAADTTNVKKGMDEGNKAAEGLGKTVDKVDGSVGKLGEAFSKAARAAQTLAVGLGAIGLARMTNETAQHTFALDMQARALGMNVQALSIYQQAVVSMGGTAEGATATLDGLRKKFTEMSRYGQMQGPDAFMFKQLGLSAQDMQDSIKDPTIALQKLSGVFESLNSTQRLYIGEKLGLDQGTIALLGEGRRGFDDLIERQKRLGFVTKEQAEDARRYKLQLAELGITMESLKRTVTGSLLPAFTWIADKIVSVSIFFQEHKTFAIAFFTGVATVLTAVYTPAIVRAAIATWALIGPFVAVALAAVAVGVAIGLIADDIDSFLKGQNSITGEIAKKWPIVGEVIRGVAEVVKFAINNMKISFQFLVDLIEKGPHAAIENFGKAVTKVFDTIFEQFPRLKKFFEGISAPIEWLTNKLGIKPSDPTSAKPADQPATAPQAKSPAAVASSGKNTATGRELAAKIYASGGWTKEQAAGIAGSFMQESGGSATAVNKSSGAYGLAQWLGSRVKDFKEFAGKDLKASSLDEQIAFFNYEVTKGKEQGAGKRLRAARTASEAAAAHSIYYERPGKEEANNGRRAQMAEAILAGQQTIAATSAPIAAQSSQSIANSRTSNRSTSVSVGELNIHTKAASADSIASAARDSLTGQLKSAADQYDDGIVA